MALELVLSTFSVPRSTPLGISIPGTLSLLLNINWIFRSVRPQSCRHGPVCLNKFLRGFCCGLFCVCIVEHFLFTPSSHSLLSLSLCPLSLVTKTRAARCLSTCSAKNKMLSFSSRRSSSSWKTFRTKCLSWSSWSFPKEWSSSVSWTLPKFSCARRPFPHTMLRCTRTGWESVSRTQR